MRKWPLQEAKARLREVVKSAERDGPQEISEFAAPGRTSRFGETIRSRETSVALSRPIDGSIASDYTSAL